VIIKDFTVIYQDRNGIRREFYLKAASACDATMVACELLPQDVEIVRCYHDPSW
jgi:hypothetical protein